jgi:hypothetical protein
MTILSRKISFSGTKTNIAMENAGFHASRLWTKAAGKF